MAYELLLDKTASDPMVLRKKTFYKAGEWNNQLLDDDAWQGNKTEVNSHPMDDDDDHDEFEEDLTSESEDSDDTEFFCDAASESCLCGDII